MTFNMERIMKLRKVALLTLIVAVLLSGAAWQEDGSIRESAPERRRWEAPIGA